MPLAFRTIQPVSLSRRLLTEEELKEDVAPIAVCHNTLLGAIVQLASLVRHADDIFCDLTEECQKVFEKTESIFSKIHNLEGIVKQLDSTEVKIPVGTLKQFSSVTDHHAAKHGYTCDHFTPVNRPYCIRVNYSMCELSPGHILRGVDLYRKDGNSSSHLFRLWPFALKDLQVDMDDVNVPKQYSSPSACRKRYKTLKVKERRRRTIHSIDDIYHKSEKLSNLQSNMGECLSKSQPSILVSVDTSGSGFERMASFRQSLSKNNPRRRTVTGVPDNILHEIEMFEKDKRILRNGQCRYSLDDLDQKDLDARDEMMQQYLQEIDSARAEREELEYADQRETKLLRFIPCRRTRSLPRCLKLITSRHHDEPTLSSMFSKKSHSKIKSEEVKLRHAEDLFAAEKFPSTASLGSLSGDDNRSSRSSKRSSLISDKIKSLVSGTLRSRPKSLDFDSFEVADESIKGSTLSPIKSATRSSSLSRVSSPSMPEGALSRATSNESQVGPGSYYYFDSNTIPRAQAKKYDFPWDSLPKDWTTSVKLREISRRRKEDRQSSSGNWSQSGYSSNRQSTDSDAKSSMPSSVSQFSFGKDSGRDSPHSTGERDGLDAGYMGDAATSTESVSDTKSASNTDSDDWIRTLAERAASREDVSSTSAEALAGLSRLTKQNIRNLDILVPGRTHFRQKRNELEDDGDSSVYSIDQEGFYTSFHSDSGLKKSTNTLLEDEDNNLVMPRVRGSKSLQSMGSYSTVESLIVRQNGNNSSGGGPSSVSAPNLASLTFPSMHLSDISESDVSEFDFHAHDDDDVEYGDTGTLKAKKKSSGTKVPPLPPPRTSSINSNSTTCHTEEGNLNSLEDSPASIETSSESSDHETIYARLKTKTNISPHAFPSWCAGIISDEDDFQDRLNAESSEVEELFSGKDNWFSGTLPRSSIIAESKTISEFDHNANSWPRIRRSNPQQFGILKTHEKEKTKPPASNPKVLNFDPVVNLFDAISPHGVQMPLSQMSSSDDSSSSPGVTAFDAHPLTYKLPTTLSRTNKDITDNEQAITEEPLSQSGMSTKHKQAIKVDRQSAPTRPWSMVLNPEELTFSSTPVRNHFISSTGKPHGLHHLQSAPGDISAIHSSSTPSVDIVGGFDPQLVTPLTAHNKSENTLSSNSTIALSDIDSSSLTYVTLSDSSPTGSTSSLNWDTDNTPNPTPMATPIHKHAPRTSPFGSSNSGNKASFTDGTVPSINHGITNSQKLNIPSYQTSSSLSSAKRREEHSICQSSASCDSSKKVTQEPGPSLTLAFLSSGCSKTSPTQDADSDGSGPNIPLRKIASSDSNNNSSSDGPEMLLPNHSDNLLPQTDHYQKQHQQKSSHYISVTDEKMCGNSTANQARNGINSACVTAIEDYSEFSGSNIKGYMPSNDNGFLKQCRTRNDLYSPADSGYGSPSVSTQPTAPTQTFSYSPSQENQQYFSIVQPQVNSSLASSVKQSSGKDSKTVPSETFMRTSSVTSNVIARSDYSGQPFKKSPVQSNELHFSANYSSQLTSKIQKTDLSQPLLNRENSSESVNSSSSAGRSDSYRVAMLVDNDKASLIPNTKPNTNDCTSKSSSGNVANRISGDARSQLTKSMPNPAPATYLDDYVSRADSYRCAVRNTQSMLLGEAVARNSSYRLATCEEEVVIDSRMDACNLWTGKTGATRDVRRMGITDIDQLKHYNNEPDNNDKSGRRRSTTRIIDTHHAKKKLAAKSESEDLINSNKPSQSDHKRFMKTSSKDKTKQKTQSSTYIRFDPIFESGEDLRASNESLRPPSIISIRTLAKTDSSETLASENAHLINQKTGSTSPTRRRSGSHGRRDDKTGLSIFGSIKTTIRSISGAKGE